MTLTPLQTTVSRLDKSLPSKDKDICRLVIDKARPYMAIRQSNKVTVCMCCGNSMVYSGNERFVKCCECGRTVEIIENIILPHNRTGSERKKKPIKTLSEHGQ